MKCLRAWDSELRSLRHFEVVTDHQNLTYFTTTRKLKERQMRWAEELSRFNFTIRYRPGREGTMPDVLSRRDQDMPTEHDSRYYHREAVLLHPEMLKGFGVGALRLNSLIVAPASTSHTLDDPPSPQPDLPSTSLGRLWDEAKAGDQYLSEVKASILRGDRRFPAALRVGPSMSECSVDADGDVCFRGRKWVPDHEPLRTRINQQAHDSILSGHPGREGTYQVLARQFYWPGISDSNRRFCHNCDMCGSNKIWKEKKHGLLKPLPVPEQKWRDLSMDFIEKLPTAGGFQHTLVITDRLTRGVILEPMDSTGTEPTADAFIRVFYRRHGLPNSIVSDRGTAFVSTIWARVCQLLGIERRLSSAHHPETDGSTERCNADIEAFLRNYVAYNQDDWPLWLPHCELALNCRTSSSTGFTPFFLDHGYNMEVVQLREPLPPRRNSPLVTGERIAKKLADAQEFAQTMLAVAKEMQERYANQHRQAAPAYKPGDKVWLDLRYLSSGRPSKKLDALHGKFTVLEKIGTHAYRLDIPTNTGIHNVFHTWLLRPAATDPLPSQHTTLPQPPPELVYDAATGEEEEEYRIRDIVDERWRRYGRGQPRREFRVRWSGWDDDTWEPATALVHTEALDRWEQRQGSEGGG